MKLTLLKLAALAALFGLFSQGAEAGSRYGTPPPLTLSPDVASPWTLQLAPRQRIGKHRTQRQRVTRQAGLRPTMPRMRKRDLRRSSGVVTASLARRQTSQKETFDRSLLPVTVAWHGTEKPGTLIVDTVQRRLYRVLPGGKARRYAVGVGKPGFEWAGIHKVSRKAEWPSWRPPAEMIERERKKGRELPTFMEGGVDNPLGARALYLGSTIYRIHGTNQDWSIGKAVSSGCIRMRNEDVMELYELVDVGTRVKVI